MSTVLVTGATGTLGREVVRQLLERGQHVRIYARQPHPSVPPNVEVFQGDIRLGTGLHEAVKGVDTIVHCVSVFEFEQGYPTDIEGAGHLIEAARAHGSPHLIFVSIVGIDHSPFSYFQAKLKVERMIEQSDLPWTILRATQFHPYVFSLIRSMEDEEAGIITIPAGSYFQPIDPSEVAQALVTLAERGPAGHVPEIGGPEVLTFDEMVQTYLRVFHKNSVIQTHMLSNEYFDVFRDDEKLTPNRAVGHITWESFLKQLV